MKFSLFALSSILFIYAVRAHPAAAQECNCSTNAETEAPVCQCSSAMTRAWNATVTNLAQSDRDRSIASRADSSPWLDLATEFAPHILSSNADRGGWSTLSLNLFQEWKSEPIITPNRSTQYRTVLELVDAQRYLARLKHRVKGELNRGATIVKQFGEQVTSVSRDLANSSAVELEESGLDLEEFNENLPGRVMAAVRKIDQYILSFSQS